MDSNNDSFVVDGKLALPYQYFAGRTGSRFIIAIRDEKKIKGLECKKCNKVYVPPRATCEHCFCDIKDNWVDLDSTGTVTGFTVVRYEEPHHPVKAPFIQALVKLEGADTPFVHIVQGVPVDEMKTGLKVKAVFAEETTTTIMDISHFEPA
ncbi:MAG: Zn-ribbon domain-containing OB-fold protein [Desulfobacterales bacterium]|jgi:uncharacterized OB-fold protein|nr:Zn-ribbon domain-containing OB-fold protein [Desulfobacteraceae bacterium]MBT4362908.1 Zn-ribbon domain-containing OB-fold protein [Desulfobacteraceae bacterium]MBT7086002.1 Zn-ribbon domain-containing OB-fold protein [Desulfobacterales bacterium]MBT7698062.1 Zn-ribbon domain-containing OB-fold protein [Desulfobacterales bacterium]